MKLSELVSPQSIFIGWPGGQKPTLIDKWVLLTQLTQETCRVFQCNPEITAAALAGIIEREKSMTTGIGMGIAIPHTSLAHLPRPLGSLCILPEGINFVSIDHKPVHIVILLLVPKGEFQLHIRTLAGIAKLFNDANFRHKLCQSTTTEQAYELIRHQETED